MLVISLYCKPLLKALLIVALLILQCALVINRTVIQDYFQDGSDFGASIEYIVEEKRMGTAGALTLLKRN